VKRRLGESAQLIGGEGEWGKRGSGEREQKENRGNGERGTGERRKEKRRKGKWVNELGTTKNFEFISTLLMQL